MARSFLSATALIALVLTSCSSPLKLKTFTLDAESLRQPNFTFIKSEAAYLIDSETENDQIEAKYGQYFTAYVDSKLVNKATIFFHFTAEKTGSKIHLKSIPVTQSKTRWSYLNAEILDKGKITSWSAKLLMDKRLIHEENSFMWTP